MEFTIDVAAIRMLLADENKTARAEIAELGVIEAYRRSAWRHDRRLATASDAASLACGAGCSWCCHFSVDVRPVEVFNILEFIRVYFNIRKNYHHLKDELISYQPHCMS